MVNTKLERLSYFFLMSLAIKIFQYNIEACQVTYQQQKEDLCYAYLTT